MEEIWDIYDKDKKRTGRTAFRGTKLASGDYHLVVFVWVKDTRGRFLLSRRWQGKQGGGMWETPAGSALAGEESREAALREVKEEIGLVIPEGELRFVKSVRHDTENPWFADYYIYESDLDIESLVCQEGEVECIRWASREEVIELMKKEAFFHGNFHYDSLVGVIL
jgi:8-oxo-dGTP pyrophosphatase MutT (NUDIX family)